MSPSSGHNWESKTFPPFQVQLSFAFLFEISQPSALPPPFSTIGTHREEDEWSHNLTRGQQAAPVDKRQGWRSWPRCPALRRGSGQTVPAGRPVLGQHALPTWRCPSQGSLRCEARSSVSATPAYISSPHAQPSPSLPTSMMTHAYADPLHQPNSPAPILPGWPPPLLCTQTCDTPAFHRRSL